MGAKFCTVKTELILLGLAAAFLGVLLGISAGDRAAAEPSAEPAGAAEPEAAGVLEPPQAARDSIITRDRPRLANFFMFFIILLS